MVIRFLILMTACLVAGCVSHDRLNLEASNGQLALVRNGQPILVSNKKNVVLLFPVQATLNARDRPSFVVMIKNNGKQMSTFTVSQVSAQCETPSGIAPLHVYSYEELRQEEQSFAAALTGLGRSLQATSSGYVTTNGTVSGSTYAFSGTYTSTTYDPARVAAAQSAAQEQTAAEFDAIRVQGAKKLEALNYSKDNTLLPSEVYAGIITLKAPDKTDGKAKYTITIPFAGETHSFQVIQTKLES